MPSIVIEVPDPEPGSFNHGRRSGILLHSQVLHLREALLRHLKDIAEILIIDPKSLKTEREVSIYVHRATAILHTHVRNPYEKEVG